MLHFLCRVLFLAAHMTTFVKRAEILIISEEYELKSSSHVCCVFHSAGAESSHGLFPADISSVFRLQFLDTIKNTHTHKDLTC